MRLCIPLALGKIPGFILWALRWKENTDGPMIRSYNVRRWLQVLNSNTNVLEPIPRWP